MNKKGFTLIELLIVVVIIGILAAIAIPKFGQTRQRAYVSAMQSDLNQLRTAMEMYYQDHTYSYAGATPANTGVSGSPGVTLTINTATTTNWTATATHSSYAGAHCDYDASVGSIGCTTP